MTLQMVLSFPNTKIMMMKKTKTNKSREEEKEERGSGEVEDKEEILTKPSKYSVIH